MSHVVRSLGGAARQTNGWIAIWNASIDVSARRGKSKQDKPFWRVRKVGWAWRRQPRGISELQSFATCTQPSSNLTTFALAPPSSASIRAEIAWSRWRPKRPAGSSSVIPSNASLPLREARRPCFTYAAYPPQDLAPSSQRYSHSAWHPSPTPSPTSSATPTPCTPYPIHHPPQRTMADGGPHAATRRTAGTCSTSPSSACHWPLPLSRSACWRTSP